MTLTRQNIMANKPSKPDSRLLALITVLSLHLSSVYGFTIDLIRRESLESSPLGFSSDPYQQVRNALRRSNIRAKTLVQRNSIEADIVTDQGEFLLKFSVGTPPVETMAIADTGSDLTWIQCKPCKDCYQQDAPIFDPRHSSSYKVVTCESKDCNIVSRRKLCDTSKDTCAYRMGYGDGSYSLGDVVKETLTLGSSDGGTAKIPNYIMGCGHTQHGTFGTGTAGIVGLGGGKVSLTSQLSPSIQGKFSYCLAPLVNWATKKPTSKMHLGGEEAVVSGAGVVSTPIISKAPDTFYFLTLEGITVGKRRINLIRRRFGRHNFTRGQESQEGNIIIDSGTTLTYLPRKLFRQVANAITRQVKLERIHDPAGILDVCFYTMDDAEVPEFIMHFKGGDVKLMANNAFVRTTELSICLAFSSAFEIAIYGNIAQSNFWVGYDLEKKMVSFKPTKCDGE